MKKPSLALLITLSVLLCLGAGYLSGVKTAEAIDGWYATLRKPWFNPPNWLFGPVWSLLYILMGVAGGLVVHKSWGKSGIGGVLFLFISQLLLNMAWSMIFFGFHAPGLALMEMLVLWGVIFVCILNFRTVSKAAAWLFVPYLLWVSFAAVLTAALWKLNS